jgi:hypothetical protein
LKGSLCRDLWAFGFAGLGILLGAAPVVTLYYEELKLREIDEVLDVTESCVSRQHTKAIPRLKAHSPAQPASMPRREKARFRGPSRLAAAAAIADQCLPTGWK